MEFNLINGSYTSNEAMQLITKIAETKITFLESKISTFQNEEDIKSIEKKIIALQQNLMALRAESTDPLQSFHISCTVAFT